MAQLGEYGRIERMRIGKSLRVKRLTEVTACFHILNPDDVQFLPPPPSPLTRWCPHCKSLKAVSEFYRNARRSTGYQPYCKTCDKAYVSEQRKRKRSHQRLSQERWYRG